MTRFYDNDKPIGQWSWDQERELLSGEVVVNTKRVHIHGGDGSAVTDAPDDFRKNNEILRQEARNRELAKRG